MLTIAHMDDGGLEVVWGLGFSFSGSLAGC